jgi:hypothetical protein
MARTALTLLMIALMRPQIHIWLLPPYRQDTTLMTSTTPFV